MAHQQLARVADFLFGGENSANGRAFQHMMGDQLGWQSSSRHRIEGRQL